MKKQNRVSKTVRQLQIIGIPEGKDRTEKIFETIISKFRRIKKKIQKEARERRKTKQKTFPAEEQRSELHLTFLYLAFHESKDRMECNIKSTETKGLNPVKLSSKSEGEEIFSQENKSWWNLFPGNNSTRNIKINYLDIRKMMGVKNSNLHKEWRASEKE